MLQELVIDAIVFGMALALGFIGVVCATMIEHLSPQDAGDQSELELDEARFEDSLDAPPGVSGPAAMGASAARPAAAYLRAVSPITAAMPLWRSPSCISSSSSTKRMSVKPANASSSIARV